jgi:aerobic carbon-monoxide dehydrogenase medium subunit
MIPVKFDYAKATSVVDAVRLLAEGGEDAKVLAGGQSLIPLLRLRLAAPTLVVDIGGVDEMRGVRDDGDVIVIGAATRHSDVLADPLVNEFASLVAKATATVADRQVRHLGTFGGALAHADPAGDLPAVAVASGAVFDIAGAGGRRQVAAADFFVDYLTTALGPDDVLVSVRLPKRPGWGTHYEKFNRMAQTWAMVGVAVALRRENGTIAEAAIGLTNMAPVPVRAVGVEGALAGANATESAIAAAAAHAAEGTSPTTDVSASADYRTHMVSVLTRRAVVAAAGLG